MGTTSTEPPKEMTTIEEVIQMNSTGETIASGWCKTICTKDSQGNQHCRLVCRDRRSGGS